MTAKSEKIIELLRQDLDLKKQIQTLQAKQREIKKQIVIILTHE